MFVYSKLCGSLLTYHNALTSNSISGEELQPMVDVRVVGFSCTCHICVAVLSQMKKMGNSLFVLISFDTIGGVV